MATLAQQQSPHVSTEEPSRESVSRDGSVEQNATSQQSMVPPAMDSAESRERLDGVLQSDASQS